MIRTVTDPGECRLLWDRFSRHERVWDEWELVDAFHDESRYELQFLVHEAGGAADGMVPLVRDRSDGSFELFGGCYPDNRVLWLRTADFPEVFEHLPEDTSFFDLNGACVEAILGEHPQYAPNFAEQDQRYFLVPSSFGWDFTNHINTFSSEKRKGFLYDLRKIRERNPDIKWSEDDEAELFIRLCNKNFGAESDYNEEEGQREVHRVVDALKEHGCLRTVTVSLEGRKEAVGLTALYKGTMIVIYSASNNDFKNLGKLLNVETIKGGCDMRANEINYMTGMAWKAAWKMNSEACYTMRKPARPVPASEPPA